MPPGSFSVLTQADLYWWYSLLIQTRDSPDKRIPKSVARSWTFWTEIAGGLVGAAALSGAGTAVNRRNSSNPGGENTRR